MWSVFTFADVFISKYVCVTAGEASTDIVELKFVLAFMHWEVHMIFSCMNYSPM